MSSTNEIVKEYLENNKPKLLGSIAEELKLTDLEVANALPYEICGVAKKEDFEEIWKELATWDKCIFILIHLGTVLEISGKLGEGKFGHGYYNLSHESGSCIGGHLKIDDLEAIAFVTLELYGKESKHVVFLNDKGETKFHVFAGRENKEMLQSVSDSFEQLKEKYAEKK